MPRDLPSFCICSWMQTFCRQCLQNRAAWSLILHHIVQDLVSGVVADLCTISVFEPTVDVAGVELQVFIDPLVAAALFLLQLEYPISHRCFEMVVILVLISHDFV